MDIALAENLEEIPANEWNRLEGGEGNPFLRHEFLAALERHGCVGEGWGWLPRHLLAREGGRLVGAVPLYLKYNSYGEFVFDWAWADAYQRAGLAYYPKLVAGVPYTPATGPRLLLAPGPERHTIADTLVEGALELARSLGVSSLHWLFTTEQDAARLEQRGLMRRTGCQFHWENRGYRDFDDFLDGFTSEKRKKLRRERRRVEEADIAIEVLDGHQAGDAQWAAFHRFYAGTFDKRGGHATLSEAFFRDLARHLPDQIVLVLARHRGRYVAGAFNLRGDDTLYGRHWGCDEEFHSLHFEACYYTGIEYCIRHGLRRFEPGAQGEHKLSRGFLPQFTWSAHWLADARFASAVGGFLAREHDAMVDYRRELSGHTPYKFGLEKVTKALTDDIG